LISFHRSPRVTLFINIIKSTLAHHFVSSCFVIQRFGKGILFCHDGIYEGHFEYNVRHGFGLIQYKDNSNYEGEWQNDQVRLKDSPVKQSNIFINNNDYHTSCHPCLQFVKRQYIAIA
jgi:hypothetical protein